MPEFAQTILNYAREGFAEVNAVQGLIVALVAALLTTRWSRLLIMALIAVAANVVIDMLRPVLFAQAELRLPPLLEPAYWNSILVLFAGFLVVIGILFALKRLVTKG